MLQYILCLCFLGLSPTHSAIEVEISGIKKKAGFIRIGLYNSDGEFLVSSYKNLIIKVVDTDNVKAVFPAIPAGTYAISIFHDENANGQLDSNFLRIPKEPYGFSNNAKATFGPPSFQEAAFNHQSTTSKIKIEL